MGVGKMERSAKGSDGDGAARCKSGIAFSANPVWAERVPRSSQRSEGVEKVAALKCRKGAFISTICSLFSLCNMGK